MRKKFYLIMLAAAVAFSACAKKPEAATPAETTPARTETAAETEASSAEAPEEQADPSELGQFTVKTDGNTMEIALYSNPTTGYEWTASAEDEAAVKIVSDEFREAEHAAGMTGAGGIQVFKLEALKEGTSDVKITYARPWENMIPLYTETFSITYDGKEISWEHESVEAPKAEQLPRFVYVGNDVPLRLICEYMIDNYGTDAPEEVTIPSPVIVEMKETDSGETLVYGNFMCYDYVADGHNLVTRGGGSWPGCMHIAETDKGYAVTEFECATDGAGMEESLLKICGGDEKLCDRVLKALDMGSDDAVSTRKFFLGIYVSNFDLDITGYQDSAGEEPEEIF